MRVLYKRKVARVLKRKTRRPFCRKFKSAWVRSHQQSSCFYELTSGTQSCRAPLFIVRVVHVSKKRACYHREAAAAVSCDAKTCALRVVSMYMLACALLLLYTLDTWTACTLLSAKCSSRCLTLYSYSSARVPVLVIVCQRSELIPKVM